MTSRRQWLAVIAGAAVSVGLARPKAKVPREVWASLLNGPSPNTVIQGAKLVLDGDGLRVAFPSEFWSGRSDDRKRQIETIADMARGAMNAYAKKVDLA